MNFYELLGVETGANNATIRRAYRRRALAVHPDKNTAPEAAELFHQLSAALEALLDPAARAKLDQQLASERQQAARRAQESERIRQMRADLQARETEAARDAGGRRAQSSRPGSTQAVDLEQLRREGYELRRAFNAAPGSAGHRTVKVVSSTLDKVLNGVSAESVLKVGNSALVVFKTLDEARQFICSARSSTTRAWTLQSFIPRLPFETYYEQTLARASLGSV